MVIAVSFAIGTARHVCDFARAGLRPYRWAPPPVEAFWSSLVLLDAAVVLLLATGRRRTGLGLATAVMVLDVAVNVTVAREFGGGSFAAPLLLQVALLGLLAGAVPFLWQRGGSAPTLASCPPLSPTG